MILYHGSNVVVDKPRILVPNRFLDFGNGFYTTTNKAQAINFADRVTDRRHVGKSSVNVYEMDDEKVNGINVLEFSAPDDEWLDFVSDNRAGTAKNGGFDLIIGPVANDDVYSTFILYSTGVLTKAQTIEALKVKKLYNQYVFTTERGLDCLKFKEVFYEKGGE